MADFPLVLTDAGRAALAAAGVGGTVNVDSIRITSGQFTPNPADTTLQGTLLKTYTPADGLSGRSAADEFEYVISDASSDAFTGARSVGAIGLYAGATLFAVSSRPSAEGFLYTKQATDEVIVACIVKVSGVSVSSITFTNLSAFPQATESLVGMARYATEAEANAETGQAADRVLSVLRFWNAVTNRLASVSEALAGTNAVKLMSPQRTRQALAAYIPPGTLMDFAGSTTPTGYLPCDGSAVSRTTYGALYGAIGTAWGAGDGSTTFNVPDLRRRVTAGAGGAAGNGLGNAVGNSGGVESGDQTVPVPPHTHDVRAIQGSAIANQGNWVVSGVAWGGHNAPGSVIYHTVTDAVQTPAGGSNQMPVNRVQPTAIVTKIIKT